MCRPRRASDQIAIDDGARHVDCYVIPSGEFDLGRACGICVELAAFNDSRGGQQLRPVTQRANRFVGFGKVANDVENFGIQAQIFRRPTAGDEKAVVARRIDVVEGGVERKVMAVFSV